MHGEAYGEDLRENSYRLLLNGTKGLNRTAHGVSK